MDDLVLISKWIQETQSRFFVLGAGSNLLVSDEGYDGIVIRANRFFTEIRKISDGRIWSGGGAMLSSLLKLACEEGWGGLEFLSGIPGSVGGAVRMNAGTHLGETSGRLRKVQAFDLHRGEEVRFEEMKFAYRKNLFLPAGHLVLGAEWEVTPSESTQVRAVVEATLTRRKADPAD